MKDTDTLATLTIAVPLKGAGGTIRQRDVTFTVSKVDGHYNATPELNLDERRLANLPEELGFEMKNGKPVSLRGAADGNFHVIEDIVDQLRRSGTL